MPSSPMEVVRAFYSALEAGVHGEGLRPLLTEDATTIEQPNLLNPSGATRDLEQILAGSSAGASLLERQHYEVRSAHVHGELVTVRVRWTAVIAKDAGPFRAGQSLVAHLAQFIETRGGKVHSIETFDCYEPLTPAQRSQPLNRPE